MCYRIQIYRSQFLGKRAAPKKLRFIRHVGLRPLRKRIVIEGPCIHKEGLGSGLGKGVGLRDTKINKTDR